MNEQEEIDYLRQKVKDLSTELGHFQHSLRSIVVELESIEGVLRRGMPVHPDYIKELREELQTDSFA